MGGTGRTKSWNRAARAKSIIKSLLWLAVFLLLIRLIYVRFPTAEQFWQFIDRLAHAR